MNGLEFCKRFYNQVVKDIVLPISPEHGAALIGPGSEVLGFDTEMSRDHGWHARCIIFTDKEEAVRAALQLHVPDKFESFGTQIEVSNAHSFFSAYLGFDPYNITDVDWLSAPTQVLRMLTDGEIFKESNELCHLRSKLSFYPRDILLYILEAGWERISQEMAFMGRCGLVKDNIGSALISARLFSFIMRLCFMYEGQYPPYWKWFGTAFNKLPCADNFKSSIEAGLMADTWQKRERYLSQAYIALGELHNKSGLAGQVEPGVIEYYSRGFMVPDTQKYKESLRAEIKSDSVKALPPNVGAVDQISDQTDFLGHNEIRLKIRGVWE